MQQIIVSSLVSGAIYTVMALGMVLVYKTTRVFNFAHGQFAALSGYVGYTATVEWQLPFVAGIVMGATAGALCGLVTERLVLRRLYRRTALELVVATFGISLLLRSIVLEVWGVDARAVPVPFGNASVDVFGATVSWYGLCVVTFGVATVALLTILLSRTELGLRMRAAFDDPVAARMTGIEVSRLRTASWTVGGSLAGIGGVLLAPILFLTPTSMDMILLVGFAAVVVGGFSSLPGAVVGGFAVAFASNIIGGYITLTYREALLYSLVILFLWVRPFGLFGQAETDEATLEGERSGRFARQLRAVAASASARLVTLRRVLVRGFPLQALVVVGVVLMIFAAPGIAGPTWQLTLTTWLVYIIAVAGLSVATFYGGRLSIAQAAWMAIGAYATASLLADTTSSWILAVALGALIAAGLGVLFELPSLRLHGAYYAVATLSLGLVVPQVAEKWTSFTGGADGKPVPPPQLGGQMLSSADYYWIVAVIAAVVLIALIAIRNSAAGRAIVAVRDSPRGALSLGLRETPRRLALGAGSAGLGGLAGGLGALQTGIVTPESYHLDLALTLFVATVLAGSILGSAWGAAVIALIPVWLQDRPTFSTGLFGLILLATLVALPRERDAADVLRLRTSRRRRPPTPVGAIALAGERPTQPHTAGPLAESFTSKVTPERRGSS